MKFEGYPFTLGRSAVNRKIRRVTTQVDPPLPPEPSVPSTPELDEIDKIYSDDDDGETPWGSL